MSVPRMVIPLGWLNDLLGLHWPEGDEDALRRVSAAWSAAAVGVLDSSQIGSQAQDAVAKAVAAPSTDDFAAVWAKYVGGNGTGDAVLDQLAQQCGMVANYADVAALQIEGTKWEMNTTAVIMYIQFIRIMIQIAASLGLLAPEGAAEEAIIAAESRSIMMMLWEALKQALMFSVVPDVISQTAEILDGHRQGYDVKSLGHDFESALVTAPLFALPGIGGKLAKDGKFGLGRFANVLADNPLLHNSLTDSAGGQLIKSAAWGGFSNVGANVLTWGADQGIKSMTGDKDWGGQGGPLDNWQQAFGNGAFMGGVFHGAEQIKGNLGHPAATITTDTGETFSLTSAAGKTVDASGSGPMRAYLHGDDPSQPARHVGTGTLGPDGTFTLQGPDGTSKTFQGAQASFFEGGRPTGSVTYDQTGPDTGSVETAGFHGDPHADPALTGGSSAGTAGGAAPATSAPAAEHDTATPEYVAPAQNPVPVERPDRGAGAPPDVAPAAAAPASVPAARPAGEPPRPPAEPSRQSPDTSRPSAPVASARPGSQPETTNRFRDQLTNSDLRGSTGSATAGSGFDQRSFAGRDDSAGRVADPVGTGGVDPRSADPRPAGPRPDDGSATGPGGVDDPRTAPQQGTGPRDSGQQGADPRVDQQQGTDPRIGQQGSGPRTADSPAGTPRVDDPRGSLPHTPGVGAPGGPLAHRPGDATGAPPPARHEPAPINATSVRRSFTPDGRDARHPDAGPLEIHAAASWLVDTHAQAKLFGDRIETVSVAAVDPADPAAPVQVRLELPSGEVRELAIRVRPHLDGDQVARTIVDDHGNLVVEIPARIAPEHVARALAHEFAEVGAQPPRTLKRMLKGHHDPIEGENAPEDALVRGRQANKAADKGKLSPHDEGRLAEARVLARQRPVGGTPEDVAERLRIDGALRDLREHLGVRDPGSAPKGPAYETGETVRRRLLPDDVRKIFDTLPPPPRPDFKITARSENNHPVAVVEHQTKFEQGSVFDGFGSDRLFPDDRALVQDALGKLSAAADLQGLSARSLHDRENSFEITDGHGDYRVIVEAGNWKTRDPSRLLFDQAGKQHVIQLADMLAPDQVRRALAVELGKITAERDRRAGNGGPGAQDPRILKATRRDPGLTDQSRLSIDDAGHVQELVQVGDELRTTVPETPGYSGIRDHEAVLHDEAMHLVDKMGLRDGVPGSDVRRRIVRDSLKTDDARAAFDEVLERAGHERTDAERHARGQRRRDSREHQEWIRNDPDRKAPPTPTRPDRAVPEDRNPVKFEPPKRRSPKKMVHDGIEALGKAESAVSNIDKEVTTLGSGGDHHPQQSTDLQHAPDILGLNTAATAALATVKVAELVAPELFARTKAAIVAAPYILKYGRRKGGIESEELPQSALPDPHSADPNAAPTQGAGGATGTSGSPGSGTRRSPGNSGARPDGPAPASDPGPPPSLAARLGNLDLADPQHGAQQAGIRPGAPAGSGGAAGSGLPPGHVSAHAPIGHGVDLENVRSYGVDGGHERVDPRFTAALEAQLPRNPDGSWVVHPKVVEAWVREINDGGPGADPGRGKNCADVVRALLETYFGNPHVGAAVMPEHDANGFPTYLGERNGIDNLEAWAGAYFEQDGVGDAGFDALEDRLAAAGPGSVAAVLVKWADSVDSYGNHVDGGWHVTACINDGGYLKWVDPQSRTISPDPPHGVDEVWSIGLDAQRQHIDPSVGQGNAAWHGGATQGSGTHGGRPNAPVITGRDGHASGPLHGSPGHRPAGPASPAEHPAQPGHPDHPQSDHTQSDHPQPDAAHVPHPRPEAPAADPAAEIPAPHYPVLDHDPSQPQGVGDVVDYMFRDPTQKMLDDLGVGQHTFKDLGYPDQADVANLPADERAAMEKALPHVAMMAPDRVHVTQRSVSDKSGDQFVTDMARKMGTTGWRGGPVHAVVWADGRVDSLDNRRVTAARISGEYGDGPLARIPVVVHGPNDRLSEWSEAWDEARRERNKLGVDIWQLPDGTLSPGIGVGEPRYKKGQVAETWGEIALFRAAEQRSGLPGHLFGSEYTPVWASKPYKRGPAQPIDITPEQESELRAAVDAGTAAAERLQPILQQVADAISERHGEFGERLELLGTKDRVKTYDSLARKYTSEGKKMSVQDFLEEKANDVARFSLRLPPGEHYTTALEETIEALRAHNLEIVDAKNFWSKGNRYFGLNTTVQDETGFRFEVQFPTAASWTANKLTHDFYEINREKEEGPDRRVNAFLGIMRINRELGLEASVPPGLDQMYPPVIKRFAKVVMGDGELWPEYEGWLADNPSAEARDLAWIAGQFGLDPADLVRESPQTPPNSGTGDPS